MYFFLNIKIAIFAETSTLSLEVLPLILKTVSSNPSPVSQAKMPIPTANQKFRATLQQLQPPKDRTTVMFSLIANSFIQAALMQVFTSADHGVNMQKPYS